MANEKGYSVAVFVSSISVFSRFVLAGFSPKSHLSTPSCLILEIIHVDLYW
jgi:hypothetical protein